MMGAWLGNGERATEKIKLMLRPEAALHGNYNFTSKPNAETYLQALIFLRIRILFKKSSLDRETYTHTHRENNLEKLQQQSEKLTPDKCTVSFYCLAFSTL